MLLAAPAVSVVVPATVSGPLSVRAPLVVTVSPPLMVEAPRSKALMSFNTTVLPLVMATVLKSLALSKVMLLAAPAASVVVPATVSGPLSVRAPLVVTVSPPLMVEAPRSRAFTSFNTTVLPLTTLTVLKSLALSKRDVVGRAGGQGGRAAHDERAATGDRPSGREIEGAGGADARDIHPITIAIGECPGRIGRIGGTRHLDPGGGRHGWAGSNARATTCGR